MCHNNIHHYTTPLTPVPCQISEGAHCTGKHLSVLLEDDRKNPLDINIFFLTEPCGTYIGLSGLLLTFVYGTYSIPISS